MSLLSLAFGAGVATRNALYDRGLLRVRRLQGPVVSIGNLSVGGAGKTPFLIRLGELLKERDVAFDVLSRGYGRASRGVRLVEPRGTPDEFGDEPLLIVHRLGMPVIVGESRYAAGQFAEANFPHRVHLLDDGFQHRQLGRDLDIVLVSAADAGDALLPAGRLREPLSSLRRAHVLALSDDADATQFSASGKLLVQVRRGIAVQDAPVRPIAFCGIARPERFFAELRAAGIEPAAELRFPDHHRYTAGEVQGIFAVRDKSPGTGFITTEKDVVNLGALAAYLEPLAVARVTMEIEGADALLDEILRRA